MYRRSFFPEAIALVAAAIASVFLMGSPASGTEFVLQMYTRDNCEPCDRWKREAMPILESIEEIKVEIRSATSSQATPTFALWHGKKNEAWTGYTTWESHRESIKQAISKLIGLEVKNCWRGYSRSGPTFPTPIRSMLAALFRPRCYYCRPRTYRATPRYAAVPATAYVPAYKVPAYRAN